MAIAIGIAHRHLLFSLLYLLACLCFGLRQRQAARELRRSKEKIDGDGGFGGMATDDVILDLLLQRVSTP